jgi:hypothetical protein
MLKCLRFLRKKKPEPEAKKEVVGDVKVISPEPLVRQEPKKIIVHSETKKRKRVPAGRMTRKDKHKRKMVRTSRRQNRRKK